MRQRKKVKYKCPEVWFSLARYKTAEKSVKQEKNKNEPLRIVRDKTRRKGERHSPEGFVED